MARIISTCVWLYLCVRSENSYLVYVGELQIAQWQTVRSTQTDTANIQTWSEVYAIPDSQWTDFNVNEQKFLTQTFTNIANTIFIIFLLEHCYNFTKGKEDNYLKMIIQNNLNASFNSIQINAITPYASSIVVHVSLKPSDVPLYYLSKSLRRKKAITLSSYVKQISYYMYS